MEKRLDWWTLFFPYPKYRAAIQEHIHAMLKMATEYRKPVLSRDLQWEWSLKFLQWVANLEPFLMITVVVWGQDSVFQPEQTPVNAKKYKMDKHTHKNRVTSDAKALIFQTIQYKYTFHDISSSMDLNVLFIS